MKILMLLLALLAWWPRPSSAAQTTPRFIEFEMAEMRGVHSYLVEVFRPDDDVSYAIPIDTILADAPAARNGSIRIPLDRLSKRLRAGEYVITVSAITGAGRSRRSAPSASFLIDGTSAGAAESASHPTPESPDPTNEQIPSPQDGTRGGRIALVLGAIIAAAAFLVPVLAK